MIKIQKQDDKNEKLSFVADMPISLANAVRRSVLEIPILAIDDVEIVKNDSALYDEIIAHRLGLIPVKTGKISKEIRFKLKVRGPKMVYSSDLKPSIETDYKIPLVLLENEQELEIVAEARLGKGTEHIKYSPGLLFYRHNIEPNILDFINIDENGKVSYNEEEIKEKVNEELMNKIKKLKEVNELIFEIESWGQIKTKDIFIKAIEALEDNLDELLKELK